MSWVKRKKRKKLIDELKVIFQKKLTYYSGFDDSNIESSFDVIQRNFLMYDQIVKMAVQFDDVDYSTSIKQEFTVYLSFFDFLTGLSRTQPVTKMP